MYVTEAFIKKSTITTHPPTPLNRRFREGVGGIFFLLFFLFLGIIPRLLLCSPHPPSKLGWGEVESTFPVKTHIRQT